MELDPMLLKNIDVGLVRELINILSKEKLST